MSFHCTVSQQLKQTCQILDCLKIPKKLYLQCRDVIVWDELEAWHEGAETIVTAGICGAGDGCHGAAPEVSI